MHRLNQEQTTRVQRVGACVGCPAGKKGGYCNREALEHANLEVLGWLKKNDVTAERSAGVGNIERFNVPRLR